MHGDLTPAPAASTNHSIPLGESRASPDETVTLRNAARIETIGERGSFHRGEFPPQMYVGMNGFKPCWMALFRR